ncbi:MAG: hypothetical protein H6747_02035 [Deltaproteobacteria bacterium]|nr:hypothetical protein [Deltaproteobacteria bacterium]
MSSFNVRPHIQPDAVTRLGLDQVRLGSAVELPRSEQSRRNLGRSSTAIPQFEPGFEPIFRRGSRPAIPVGDFLVEKVRTADGEAWRLRCDAEELAVSTAGDDLLPWTVDPADPSIVYIQPGADAACTIAKPDGRGVVVVSEPGRGLFAYDFRPRTGVTAIPAALTPVRSPAPDWVTAADPAWLAELIRSRAQRRGPFNAAVSVGIWARLREPDPSSRMLALDALLLGAADPDLERPHAFFAELPAGVQRAVVEGALAHVTALHGSLDMLVAKLDLESPAWRDALLAALHLRDDIESALVLLRGAGQADIVESALRPVDRSFGLFVRSMPRPLRLGDARLQRIAEVEHDAWWSATPILR